MFDSSSDSSSEDPFADAEDDVPLVALKKAAKPATKKKTAPKKKIKKKDSKNAKKKKPATKKKAVLAALEGAGYDAIGILRDASVALRNDVEVVRAAVAENGYALRHASEALKDDPEVVRAAVAQTGRALEYASEALQNDPATVRVAVAERGDALLWASDALQDDADTVRLAVAQDGDALEYVSDAQKDDADTVRLAVAQRGQALQYASAALQDDAATVRVAVAVDADALRFASVAVQNDAATVRVAVAQDGWALEHASAALRNDAATVRLAVANHGFALQYASDSLKDDAATVRLAVAQSGYALQYGSATLQDDAATVWVAVAQDGIALQFASDALKDQYGYTAAEFLANAPQAAAAAAAGNGATPADASSPPPSKRRKLDPQVEARLAAMMQDKSNVASPPLNTLEQSAYLKCYQGCPAPRTGKHPWGDPLAAVADSLPRDFHKEEWEKALAESAGVAAAGSTLRQAGAACTRLWSKNAMFRLVQRVILEGDAQLLERIMPFIKCLNAFILDKKGLLTMLTTVYRASRMTKLQETQIQVGEKYRLGMYVATSTREAAAEGLMGWQAGEMGSEVKYRWRFTIPKGCRQAAKISDVSAYADEDEVLLVPYSAILVTGKSFDKETGMIQVDAEVLPDSMLESLDLPTVTA